MYFELGQKRTVLLRAAWQCPKDGTLDLGLTARRHPSIHLYASLPRPVPSRLFCCPGLEGMDMC